MYRFRDPGVLFRILIPAVLAGLLLIAPRPAVFSSELRQGQAASRAGYHEAAAGHFAAAAQYYPRRGELWERAGLEAFTAGDIPAAINYLQKALDLGSLSRAEKKTLGQAYLEDGDIDRAIEILESTLPDPESSRILAQVYRSQRMYDQAIACLKAVLQAQPGDASTAYLIGLLTAAVDPPASFSYLAQAAGLDPQLAAAAAQVRSPIRTAQLSDEPAYVYLAAGRALAGLGEWDLAEEAFTRAVRLRPDFPEAWAYLGEVRQHLSADSAGGPGPLADLQRAYELDPASLSANLFLAFYYQRQGSYEQALKYLYEAARLDPQNPVIHTEIGSTLAALGDLPGAQKAYEKAIELDPDNPVYYRILAGFALSHQIQVRDLALPAARRAVILDPQDPAGLDLLGQTFYQLGDFVTAERFLERAVQANPDYPPAHLHMGMNYLLQGRLDEAYRSLLKTLRLSPGSSSAETAQRLLERYFHNH